MLDLIRPLVVSNTTKIVLLSLDGLGGLPRPETGRSELETARVEDMQARVNYDLEYLRRWSPLLDLKILFLTAIRLLRDEKAY